MSDDQGNLVALVHPQHKFYWRPTVLVASTVTVVARSLFTDIQGAEGTLYLRIPSVSEFLLTAGPRIIAPLSFLQYESGWASIPISTTCKGGCWFNWNPHTFPPLFPSTMTRKDPLCHCEGQLSYRCHLCLPNEGETGKKITTHFPTTLILSVWINIIRSWMMVC